MRIQRSTLLIVILGLMVSVPVVAGPGLTTQPGPHPDAPEALKRLAPLVGEWDITTRSRGQDGTSQEGKASWSFFFIMDGWALMDEWRAQRPDGSEMVGINIRHADPESGRIVAKWLPNQSLIWDTFDADWVDDAFVMTGLSHGPGGTTGQARVTFYDFTESTFLWSLDWSADEGETWIDDVFSIEGKRVDE